MPVRVNPTLLGEVGADMYLWSNENFAQSRQALGGLSAGLGQPPAASPVRTFTCSEANRKTIAAIVGKPVSIPDLQAALTAAVRRAIVLSSGAIRALEKSPRSGTTKTLFREIFGTFPEFVPDWRTADAVWKDRGALVALRLKSAAGLLASGELKYHCWGCPGGDRAPTTYNACNHPAGSYVLGLGKGFWENLNSTDGVEYMAMVLLHEALHAYYASVIDARHEGRYGNAYCYQRFVSEINGLSLYPETEKACASVLRRGSRGVEVGKLQKLLNLWIQSPVITMSLIDKPPALRVNRVFDRATETALRAFQNAVSLTPSGIADSDTWRKLTSQQP